MHRFERYHFWAGDKCYTYPPYHKRSFRSKVFNSLLSLFLEEKRKLPDGIIPYGGSTWWVISRACAEYLNDFINSPAGRRLINYFRYTRHSDEIFFQTVILNSPLRDTVINDNLRFIDFSRKDLHPEILTKDDVSRLADSRKLFGRKFDSEIDADILDMIDEATG